MDSLCPPQLDDAKVKLQRTRKKVDEFQPTIREHEPLIDALQSHLGRLDKALQELDHLRQLMSRPSRRQRVHRLDSQQTH